MPLISRGSTTLSVAVALGLWLTVTPSAQRGGGGQQPPNPAVEPLRFRYMGPPIAGRISAVAGVPGDTTTYYAGAASGGVWKTTDGGATFAPIFDDQTVAGDRRARRRPVRSEHRLGRHRRSVGDPRAT